MLFWILLHNNLILKKISIFADDTKLASIVGEINSNLRVQSDLNLLNEFAHKWQISFNFKKCKVFYLGNGNRKFNYEMEGHWFDADDDEKDLGVIIITHLNFLSSVWKEEIEKIES